MFREQRVSARIPACSPLIDVMPQAEQAAGCGIEERNDPSTSPLPNLPLNRPKPGSTKTIATARLGRPGELAGSARFSPSEIYRTPLRSEGLCLDELL